MSNQRLNLVPTDKLLRVMSALAANEDFVELMKLMQDRAEGLSMWSSAVKSKTKLRWAQGRVAEMMDWLYLWHNHREIKRHMELEASVKTVEW